MKLAIIDYGASNLQSVCNALTTLNQEYEVVATPDHLERFDKLILPGVGAAGASMQQLSERGFGEGLPTVTKPLLGICVGLQLLAESSEENDTRCLAILHGKVKRFPSTVKVPQIGWNQVKLKKQTLLLEGIPDGSYFYFVNSYYFDSPDSWVLGTTRYGLDFASVIQKDNFYGVQFHPEKSGKPGLQVLRNFCEKC